ncbi:hypothetical protein P4B35_08610 [Pontiellaceae bacterium B12227]|nr:hypothetical protein [Pontiellaceae bacterium B12227]
MMYYSIGSPEQTSAKEFLESCCGNDLKVKELADKARAMILSYTEHRKFNADPAALEEAVEWLGLVAYANELEKGRGSETDSAQKQINKAGRGVFVRKYLEDLNDSLINMPDDVSQELQVALNTIGNDFIIQRSKIEHLTGRPVKLDSNEERIVRELFLDATQHFSEAIGLAVEHIGKSGLFFKKSAYKEPDQLIVELVRVYKSIFESCNQKSKASATPSGPLYTFVAETYSLFDLLHEDVESGLRGALEKILKSFNDADLSLD